MNVPLRDIVNDIAVDLRQIFDDRRISDVQIAYWTIIVANNLRAKHIQKRSSGAFLTTFAEIPVLTSEIPGDNLVRYRKYFDLPECIYDFNNDAAINYITFSVHPELPNSEPPLMNVVFSRTTPAALRALNMNPHTKPDGKNPYFYRSGNRIYLIGVECVNIKNVEIGLYLCIDPVQKIDLDANFDFPAELISILKRQVLDMGRFALLIPKERINDGDDAVKGNQVPNNKIVSVNDVNTDV